MSKPRIGRPNLTERRTRALESIAESLATLTLYLDTGFPVTAYTPIQIQKVTTDKSKALKPDFLSAL